MDKKKPIRRKRTGQKKGGIPSHLYTNLNTTIDDKGIHTLWKVVIVERGLEPPYTRAFGPCLWKDLPNVIKENGWYKMGCDVLYNGIFILEPE